MKNTIKLVLPFLIISCLSGCPMFRATGDAVGSVGEGAGEVVEGVGNGVSDAVTGTGRAIKRGVNQTVDTVD